MGRGLRYAGIVLAALASAPAVAAPRGGSGTVPAPPTRSVEPELLVLGAALRAARAQPDAPTRPLVERILRAGPNAARASFDVLVEERVPESAPGDALQILSAPQRGILLAAVARMPADEVRALLVARLAAGTEIDPRTSLAALRVLGAIGTSRDLQRLVALAPRKSLDSGSLTRAGRDSLREAAVSILARDPRAWDFVGDVIRTAEHAVARPLLEAVAAGRDPRALRVLAEAARVQRDLAALCVAGAQRVGPSMDADVVADFVAWMAGELPSARPEARRGLLQAIGTLDDGTHAHELVESLSDEDAGVRESALWGLRKLSGYGFSATPEPWIAWLAGETRWNERERPALRLQLESSDPGHVAEALRAYSGRRAWREALAEDVALVLDRSEPALRLLACEVLESLRAVSAIRPMASLLSAPEEGVRDAAWRALGTISGLDLPKDPAAALERLLL